jgi:hypothetical protein
MNTENILRTLAVLSLCLYSSSALAASSDWDGDGKSDPVAVAGKKLTWSALINETATPIVSFFGSPTDILVPGDYNGDGITEAAFINSKGVWSIYNPTATPSEEVTVSTFSHGPSSATYIAGADIDGDGKDDAIYFTNACKSKKMAVKVLSDPLGQRTPYTLKGGKGNQFATFGDADGDGSDDFCYLNPLKKTGRFSMYCKNVLTKNRVARFKTGVVYNTPIPVSRGAGIPVYFAIPRIAKGITSVRVIDTNGSLVKSIKHTGEAIVLVGHYTTATGPEQIALAAGGTLTVYDVASDATSTITAPEGFLLDDINIAAHQKKLKNCACTTKKMKKNRYCPTLGGGGGGNKCGKYQGLNDGMGGWVHKPVSDSTHSIVNLVPSSLNTTSCRYEQTNGKKVRDAYTSGRTNGNRPTWRPVGGGGCSSFPNNLVFNCTVDKKTMCWKIPDPCQRYD